MWADDDLANHTPFRWMFIHFHKKGEISNRRLTGRGQIMPDCDEVLVRRPLLISNHFQQQSGLVVSMGEQQSTQVFIGCSLIADFVYFDRAINLSLRSLWDNCWNKRSRDSLNLFMVLDRCKQILRTSLLLLLLCIIPVYKSGAGQSADQNGINFGIML